MEFQSMECPSRCNKSSTTAASGKQQQQQHQQMQQVMSSPRLILGLPTFPYPEHSPSSPQQSGPPTTKTHTQSEAAARPSEGYHGLEPTLPQRMLYRAPCRYANTHSIGI